MGEIAFVRVCK